MQAQGRNLLCRAFFSHPDRCLSTIVHAPAGRNHQRGSYLVGSIQLLLGMVVLIYPWEPIPIVLSIASVWCIITGIFLLIDARQRRTHAIFGKRKKY